MSAITPDQARSRARLLRDEAAGLPLGHIDRYERLLRAADRFESLARRMEWDNERPRAGVAA